MWRSGLKNRKEYAVCDYTNFIQVSVMERISYNVRKGVIYTSEVLPYAPRWFCDGRLAFQVDNEGIADINFWGAQSDHYIAFHKRFWGGIRFYGTDEKGKVLLKPQKCKIMPFGFESKQEVAL